MTRPAHIAVATILRLEVVRAIGRTRQLTFGDAFQITIGGEAGRFVGGGELFFHDESLSRIEYKEAGDKQFPADPPRLPTLLWLVRVRLRLEVIGRIGRTSQTTFGDSFQITIGGEVGRFIRRGGLRVHPSSVNN